MITRRRFLTISAAMAASPALARPHEWRGFALGAEVSVTLDLPGDPRGLTTRIEAELRSTEAAFSLYDPGSDLSRLNASGTLDLTPHWRALLPQIDALHSATSGLFDPTVQPLWQAIAQRKDTAAARELIGWHRVRHDASHLHLDPGQKLTLNGIAQGYATDRVRQILSDAGLTKCLINIGEHGAIGGPFRLGLSDPAHGHIGQMTLQDSAIATSSPAATPLGTDGHILHAEARPQWSTVSVMADTATLADGLSTALALAPLPQVRQIAKRADMRRVLLVSDTGDLITL
ncbi:MULTISPECIES: FAD:protein FMN transferase [unclassified Marinovum]